MSSSWLTKDLRASIYRRDRGTCCYCGCELHVGAHNSDPQAASIDHITARDNGGDLCNPKNLVAVCASCNSSKGSVPLRNWTIRVGLDLRIIRAEIKRRTERKV